MNSIYAAAKTCRVTNTHFFQLLCVNKHTAAAIKIPNRIPRGPTDILKALETTVSYDLTGPSYKHSDDPHLAPYFERQGKMFSLAKSAGRKAARWVRDQHPELFTQVISDPPVMSYMPPPPINADTVNEQMLLQKMSEAKVSDAIKVYELMQEKKMEVSQDVQLALLEFLCFHNCEDPIPMDDPADRFHGQGRVFKDPTVNSWQDHSMIKSLFESLQHLGSAPYSALITGMFKAGAKPEGDKLVVEAKEKKIKLTVYAYNAMILRRISVYDKVEVKIDAVLNILKEMESEGVKPNIGTLNATLDTVGRNNFRGKSNFLIQLLVEFNTAGVKPSIGSYGLIIRSLIGKSKPEVNLHAFVRSIVKSLEGQELEMKHPSDNLFFDWCIKACVVTQDLDCAIQCLDLFLHSKNRQLLDGTKTVTFYNNFFQVLSLKADFETLLSYYNLLVPHAHSPIPEFYTMLFEACDVNGAIKEVPKFWRHYMATGDLHEETVMKMLEVAVNTSGLPDPDAVEVRPVLSALAEKLLDYKISSGRDRLFEKVPLTAEMLNLFAILFARGCNWRAVQKSLQFMNEKSMYPEQRSVLEVIDKCYEHGNPNMAVWIIKYCMTSFGPHLNLKNETVKMLESDFLSSDLKRELKEAIDDDSSSSSGSSSSDSESSDSDDDSSDSGEDMSVPKKEKPKVPKPDITKRV